jgi:PTH1 family peptidyl-tRNA hydrolase
VENRKSRALKRHFRIKTSKFEIKKPDVYLIAGLGNPGRIYKKNRHNVGFMLLDNIAKAAGESFRRFSSFSSVCKITLREKQVILLKPKTYMNLSGSSVREVVDYFKIEIPASLIVYDEIALPLGSLRFRQQGSSGGHRGMQSVIEHLGTKEIPRLRIGIAGTSQKRSLADYVLSNFKKSEKETLSNVLHMSAEGIESFITDGINRTMSLFNRKEKVIDTD